MVFLSLLPFCGCAATDDWCDLILESRGCSALSLETNISINSHELAEMVQKKLLPKFVLELESIPHGFREKVVFPLADLGKKTESRLPINDIYFLGPETARAKSDSPSGEELDVLFSAASGHLPLCELQNEHFPLEQISDSGQRETVKKMLCERFVFFQDLAEKIRVGEVSFRFLRYEKNETALQKMIHEIAR